MCNKSLVCCILERSLIDILITIVTARTINPVLTRVAWIAAATTLPLHVDVVTADVIINIGQVLLQVLLLEPVLLSSVEGHLEDVVECFLLMRDVKAQVLISRWRCKCATTFQVVDGESVVVAVVLLFSGSALHLLVVAAAF